MSWTKKKERKNIANWWDIAVDIALFRGRQTGHYKCTYEVTELEELTIWIGEANSRGLKDSLTPLPEFYITRDPTGGYKGLIPSRRSQGDLRNDPFLKVMQYNCDHYNIGRREWIQTDFFGRKGWYTTRCVSVTPMLPTRGNNGPKPHHGRPKVAPCDCKVNASRATGTEFFA